MKSLAVDFGERRVGLAVSDPEGRIAVPLGTLERRTDAQLVRELAALAADEGVERLVIGEPLGLDGSRGPACERVASFAAKLGRATGLPYVMVAESLTSHAAQARLRAAGLDPRRAAARVDAVAAQILLEEALERDAGAAKP